MVEFCPPPPPAPPPPPVAPYVVATSRDQETAWAQAQTQHTEHTEQLVLVSTPTTPDSESLSRFDWTARSAQAAILVADGMMTMAKIAVACQCDVESILRWNQHPTFRRRVLELVRIATADAENLVLGTKAGRMRRALQIAESYALVREERAISATPELYVGDGPPPQIDFDPELAAAPGGRSGIIVRKIKVVGSGPNAERVVEFSTDNAAATAELAAMEQIAREQGQWTEKSESTVLQKAYIGIDIDMV